MFFAAVLFFAGISLRLEWRPLRIMVLALAPAMLLGGAGSCSRSPSLDLPASTRDLIAPIG